MQTDEKKMIDRSRGLYYLLFGILLSEVELEQNKQRVSELLELFIASPFANEIEDDLQKLKVVVDDNYEELIDEYQNLFIIPFESPIRKTLSSIEDDREMGRKLLEVKELIAHTAFRRNEKMCNIPEDDFGFIFLSLALLCEKLSEEEGCKYESVQSAFFELVSKFIDIFITSLLKHKNSNHYKYVARILSAFIDFEHYYFENQKSIKG